MIILILTVLTLDQPLAGSGESLIEGDNVVINRSTGTVAVDAIGVESQPFRANVKYPGRLSFQGKATGVLLAGHNNRVELTGSTATVTDNLR